MPMPLLTLPPAVAFRSLYHREWRLELWHLTVGDLLHGNDPLHQHDQSTDTWRGGERWRLLKCSCSRDIQENSCCHCDWFWHWYIFWVSRVSESTFTAIWPSLSLLCFSVMCFRVPYACSARLPHWNLQDYEQLLAVWSQKQTIF